MHAMLTLAREDTLQPIQFLLFAVLTFKVIQGR